MGATGRSRQATYDQRARPSSMEALITEAMGGFEFEWILRRQCTRSSVARSDAGHRGLAEPKRWSHQGGVPRESLCISWKIINQCIFKPNKPI